MEFKEVNTQTVAILFCIYVRNKIPTNSWRCRHAFVYINSMSVLSVSIVSDEVLLNIEYKVECEENVHVIVEVRRLQSDEKTIIN